MTDTDDFPCVTIEPAAPANAAVIWLHGLGADGHDFAPIVPMLKLPSGVAVRFVLPHAPERAVTINHGMRMRAWYDITGDEARRGEDEAGIRQSGATLHRFIDREVSRGIAPARIAIAGFSQGGAIALHGGLRYPARLAGIAALSTYLPLAGHLSAERAEANRRLPVLMIHGTQDSVIPLELATRSAAHLKEAGYPVEWRTYPMAHSVCPEEIDLISDWFGRVFTDAG